MRDLLSKLDALVSETALKDKEDLEAKRQALDDLEADPVASKDPEISAAIDQRRSDLEKEAKSKGFNEDQDVYEIGDSFGISFSEDFEIGTEIVDIVEDGIVIDLDETALEFLTQNGFTFEEVQFNEEKQKGLDGKACWKGYRRMGTKMKGGKRVDNCVKVGEDSDVEESGLQYYTGVKKHGKEYMTKAAQAARNGASQKELGALKDKYSKAYKEDTAEGDVDGIETILSLLKEFVKTREEPEDRKIIAKIYKAFQQGMEPGFTELYNAWEFDIDADFTYFAGSKGIDLHAVADQAGFDTDSIMGKGMTKGVDEAKYQGREVPLGKPMKGDVKKSKVYVRGPKGNVVKVNFGDKKMRIKKSNPNRRKSFRARHNCSNPGPRWKARYWSCRAW